jgi:SAM-dependent methyltransferase
MERRQPAELDEVQRRERAYHDAIADALDPPSMPPSEPDEYEWLLLDELGPLSGARVVELGCGAGDLTFHLLERGARVTAVDISTSMARVARARLELFRPGAEFQVLQAPVEATGLLDASADLVVGKWILHHVDTARAADEIARVLRPGGSGLFLEHQGLNPLLTFARERLAGRFGIPRFGTPDEHPLTEHDFEAIASRFSSLALDYPVFEFAGMVNRQVLRDRYARPARALAAVDRLVWRRAPRLRRYSFSVVVHVTK